MGSPIDPEKRPALEPGRIASTKIKLKQLGWEVRKGVRHDPFRSMRLTSPAGKRFVFWPYSGWFQGSGPANKSGRGFDKLLKAGE